MVNTSFLISSFQHTCFVTIVIHFGLRYSGLAYTNADGMKVADGYPSSTTSRSFVVSLNVYPMENNALCVTARNDILGRRKRQLDGKI